MAKKASKLEALISIGNKMSHVFFNLSQRNSPIEAFITRDDTRNLYQQWDHARNELCRSMARKPKGG